MNKALKQILKRHDETEGMNYIEVFAGDDKKSGKKPLSNFFNIEKDTLENIQKEYENKNTGNYGVFLNINPLSKAKRIKDNIKKILYVFIDLDDAQEEHNELIKTHLKKLGISYSYNGRSGHGFHFLVPVDLKKTNEPKIKGFLNYLKTNCTDKVDLATSDLGRLMRIPESIHHKDETPKKLKTLFLKDCTEDEIKNNSDLVLENQVEQKKGKKDIQYSNSIQRDDTFFSDLFSSVVNISNTERNLEKAKNRNNVFIRNLATYSLRNPEKEAIIIDFLSNWESSRVAAFKGWQKKAKENNFTINYPELYKWSKENDLTDWVILLKKQLSISFLDKYEFYYLEDEKKENSYLMYYPEKNYYVSKGLPDILTNIYYDAIESGVNFEKELNIHKIIEDYDEKSFKDKITIIKALINSKIHRENRIKLVYNINYEPTDEKFISLEKKKFFNTYSKTDLWDYNKPSEKYQFEHIKELIMNLCGKDEKNFNYFNKWLGWIIQNPTEKLPTSIIFQGRQGSGKGTFKNLILDNIFGTSNCQEINQMHLESQFNEYLLGKQIIVANEVMHNENRQTLPNVLKNLVTDETLTISRKFKKEIVAKNYTHWIFCTNSDNPIKIDEDDRRYSVFYSTKLRRGLAKELRSNLEYELKEYISYLKSLDIEFEDVSEPVMTAAKKEIIEMNLDSVERFRQSLQSYSNLHEAFINIFGTDKEYTILDNFGDGSLYLPTEKMYLLYEKYCEVTKEKGIFSKQNFSKRLSNKGIKSVPKWKDNKTHRTFDLDILHQWVKIE